MSKRYLIHILLVLSVLVIFISSKDEEIKSPVKSLPQLGEAPSFSLLATDNTPFIFSPKEERIRLVSFFFSRCPSICPKINSTLKKIISDLDKDKKEQVQIVSISVDPEYDTPEVLAKYAKEYRDSSNNWQFLTGSSTIVEELLNNGFKLASGMLPDEHNTRVVLVDKNGQIRGFYQGMDDAQLSLLAKDLKLLMR